VWARVDSYLMVAKNARTASLPRHRCHVRRHEHRVCGVELGNGVGVAAARERGHLAFAASMACLASAVGVGRGGRLAAECGGDERGNVRDESHDGSPLGEGEDDTALPCYRKRCSLEERGGPAYLVVISWNDSCRAGRFRTEGEAVMKRREFWK